MPVDLQQSDGTTTRWGGTGNAANVTCGNCSGSGVSHVDDAAFTPGIDDMVPIGGVFDDTSPDSVNENDAGAVRMSSNRNLYMTIRDAAGNERGVNVTAANALVVDGSGVVQTVDGTLDVRQAGTWTVQPGNTANTTPWLMRPHDGTLGATVRDTGTNDSLNVAIVDGSGNQITSFGGGTQYTEDDAAAANPTGTAPILVRADSPGTITSANGDNVAQRGTNYGAAYVQVVTSSGAYVDAFGGSGGTALADRGSFTDGTTSATPISGCFNETNTDPSEDQAACVRITAERGLHVSPRAADGSVLLPTAAALADTTANPTTTGIASYNMCFNGTTWDRCVKATTGNGAVDSNTQRVTIASDSTGNIATIGTSVTPGTGATHLGKAEDAAHTTGDVGIMSLAVRRDTAAVGSGTDGDYSTLNVNASGRLYTSTTIDAALPAGTNNIGDVDILSFPDNEPFNQAQIGGISVVGGACQTEQPLYVAISQTAGSQLITGTSSERIYICSLQIVTATAQNIALVDGTGTTCGTGPTGLLGGSTAATGWNFAVNGGIVLPNDPYGWAKTSTDADNVCLLQSGSGQVSGSISYVSRANL
jgi:hypothetical protein